jgi:hypothetical protein
MDNPVQLASLLRQLITQAGVLLLRASSFDGAARAIRCAGATRERSEQDGLQVRAGVHPGEVERDADDIRGGVAVHALTP